MSKIFHLPGLNGLRAIAAFAVVYSHTLREGPVFGFAKPEMGIAIARYGVTIFFALSGFLITYLLILEKGKKGLINIKSFYFRRALRIWPLYYLYLAIAIGVIAFIDREGLNGNLGFYIFFSANVPYIIGSTLPILDHYWSLGVEEQFYAFWPWVVEKTKRLIRFLVIFIVIFLLFKFACRLLYGYTGILWPYAIFETTRFDCMAIGALGAVFSANKNQLFHKIVLNPLVELFAWGVIVLLFFRNLPVYAVIANEVIAVVSVILIMNVSLNQRSLIKLDNHVFNFLGKISYGVYVIHPLVILVSINLLPDILANSSAFIKYLVWFSFVVIFTILLAYLSYQFIERRFLQIKRKFEVIPSAPNLNKVEAAVLVEPVPNSKKVQV